MRRSARSRQSRALGISLGVCLLCLVAASSAGAVTSATYTGTSIGPDGTAATTFSYLQSIVVDQGTGDVYAYDAGAGKVYKFDSEGDSLGFSALAGNAIEGIESNGESAAVYQVAVAPVGSPAGTEGDIYVATGTTVEVFAASGLRLGEFGPSGACGVATDPSGDVLVGNFAGATEYLPSGNPPSSGDQVGTTKAPLPTSSCNVAADGLSSVYVADSTGAGITKLNPLSAPSGTLLDPRATTLAVDSATTSDVYADEGNAVAKYDSKGNLLIRFAESGAGAVNGSSGIAVNGTTGGSASGDVYVNAGLAAQQIAIFSPIILPDVEVGPPTAVTPTAATLTGTINPDNGPAATCKFQYVDEEAFQAEGFAGAATVPCSPGGPFTGASAEPVSAEASGLILGTDYRFRLLASNKNGSNPSRRSAAFGPPQIATASVSEVTPTEAQLGAAINPENLATSYYVEYVSEAQYAVTGYAGATRAPLGGASIAAGPAAVEVPQRLSGLAPLTTYHFRFFAENAAGTREGEDRTLTTYTTGTSGIADGRAYEMVSPPEKNGAEIGIPEGLGGSIEGGEVRPLQAEPGGEAVTYSSFTPFGAVQGAPGTSQYLSRRTAQGWITDNITPPNEPEVEFRDPLQGFSEDLSRAVVAQAAPTLTPDAQSAYANLYLQNNLSGVRELLTPGTPQTTEERQLYHVYFAGASRGFGRLIYSATGVIGGEGAAGNSVNLYEWSGGRLALSSRLPDNAPAEGTPCFGRSTNAGNCAPLASFLGRAISADGSRIFWTDRGGSYEGSLNPLFARVNGDETVQLDAIQGGPGPGGGGNFWTASVDGSRVFFTDKPVLTSDGSVGPREDLYEYDLAAPAGSRLRDLTVDRTDPEGANVEAVLGASEDGSYLYFVASGVLAPGAQANQPNLYAWHNGQTSLVATISPGDFYLNNPTVPSNSAPKYRTARVSPDGRHLIFSSLAQLTGYDNRDQASGEAASETFLYGAEGGQLSCVSCNPSGARPIGRADTPIWENPGELAPPPYQEPRYLAANGNRVFFESDDSLVRADTNGRQDVYEWERVGTGDCTAGSAGFSAGSVGCVSLISTGRSADKSYFADASADGRDVFFLTRQPLLPQDEDERFDMYDARIGGGFPSSPPTAPCSGEACRGSVAGPAPAAAPGSAGVRGAGNVARPRRCAQGKVASKRHGKRRCVKRRHRHHSYHRRHSHRHRHAQRGDSGQRSEHPRLPSARRELGLSRRWSR